VIEKRKYDLINRKKTISKLKGEAEAEAEVKRKSGVAYLKNFEGIRTTAAESR